MALIYADRVKETSATTGTGTMTLAGAVAGFQSFNDAMADNDTCYYTITDGTDWEVGFGTYNTGTLARTTPISSSTGTTINWTGATEIFLTIPAALPATTVLGQGTPTDNSIVRYDGSSGLVIQPTSVIIDDTNNISGIGNISLSGTVDGRDIATDGSKLDGIEAGADVTDTTNVTAAGALMDSELASITDVKALNQSVISGASPTFGTVNMTDATNKRFMTDAQETKLDGVESGATADQSASELLAAVGPLLMPVGFIVELGVSTNPGTLYGFGTWTQISNRVIVGQGSGTFATLDATGGAETHTLTSAEMPSHTHTQNAHTHTQNPHAHSPAAGSNFMSWPGTQGLGGSGFTINLQTTTANATATNQNATATNQNTGGGGAHNNLQPYIVKYIWQRTA